MNVITSLAPAKINLCLHIIGRRQDGYHLLQTAIQFLEFGDTLNFSLRKDGELLLTATGAVIALQTNLIWRAACLLQQTTDCRLGADIHLIKQIPLGAGLGGGSSDAATTLVALNFLWQTGLSREALAALGAQLGADIPVFVHGHAAWVEGIGEHVTAVDFPEKWCLLVFPDCHIATQEIYRAQELTRDTPAITIDAFLAEGGHNDCERVVRRHYPQVDAVFAALQPIQARLTGTGSTVYALFENQQQAEQAANQLPPTFQRRIVKTRNLSPILKIGV